MMIPLLIRGLRERATAVKRKSALIIDNMAKVRTRHFCPWPVLQTNTHLHPTLCFLPCSARACLHVLV